MTTETIKLPGYELVGTGGGCEALVYPEKFYGTPDRWYVMVTDNEDPSVPETFETHLAFGIYRESEDAEDEFNIAFSTVDPFHPENSKKLAEYFSEGLKVVVDLLNRQEEFERVMNDDTSMWFSVNLQEVITQAKAQGIGIDNEPMRKFIMQQANYITSLQNQVRELYRIINKPLSGGDENA